MIKKTITYTDYNGVKRTEDHYFNISKAEITEMELNESQMAKDGNVTGGLEEKFNTIIEGGSGRDILAAFKDIIFMSYGVKDEDGRRFRKSAELSKEFSETEAYSELFMELISDEVSAAEFIRGALPSDFSTTNKDSDKPDPSRRPQAPAPKEEPVEEKKVEPTAEQIQKYLDDLNKK